MKQTVSGIRVTVKAWAIAKKKAKETGLSMTDWVSRAIEEKALLDDLTEFKE